jgi:zinc protease
MFVLACALTACSADRLVAPLRYGVHAPAPDESFRAHPPPTPAVTEMRDVVRDTTLPNGLRVVLVERHDFPVVATRLLVDRGSLDLDDPSGLEVAEMVRLFGRGGDQAVLDRLGDLSATTGVGWSMSLADDSISVSTRGPSSAFDASLEILAENIHPRLTPGEYDRRSAELAQTAAWRPSSVRMVERDVLFGRDHAYGSRLPGGKPITEESAQILHDRLFQPTHATLVIVGDVTPLQVDESTARRLGGWTAARTVPRNTAPPPPRNGPRLVVYNRGGLAQRFGSVFARGPLPTSDDADAFALAARILGGAKSSALFEQLREGSGAAYSIDVPFIRDRVATWLSVFASYDGDKAIDGVRDVLKAIEALRNGSVSDGEIVVARETLIAQWRGSMAVVQDAAAEYATGIALGIEPSRVQDYPARIGRLQREDLVRVAKRYLDPNALHVAFLGEERWFNPESLGMGGSTSITLKP